MSFWILWVLLKIRARILIFWMDRNLLIHIAATVTLICSIRSDHRNPTHIDHGPTYLIWPICVPYYLRVLRHWEKRDMQVSGKLLKTVTSSDIQDICNKTNLSAKRCAFQNVHVINLNIPRPIVVKCSFMIVKSILGDAISWILLKWMECLEWDWHKSWYIFQIVCQVNQLNSHLST